MGLVVGEMFLRRGLGLWIDGVYCCSWWFYFNIFFGIVFSVFVIVYEGYYCWFFIEEDNKA